jgi:hypothetical protein
MALDHCGSRFEATEGLKKSLPVMRGKEKTAPILQKPI